MKFELPRLQYAPDALAPTISQQTVEYHYGKHTKAYIESTNKLIENTDFSSMSLEEIVINASPGSLLNNSAQALNHLLYFSQFNPEGSHTPCNIIEKAINEQFSNFEIFKNKMIDAGMGVFGSGWIWLSADAEGKLFITQSANANTPLTSGLKPILTIDVWEHAYYLDYQNQRIEYLKKIWDIIDWKIVDSRYISNIAK